MKLSARQKDVLDFILDYKRAHDYSPCLSDIATAKALGVSTVVAHMKALKRKGAIDWQEGIPRSIRVMV